MEISLLILFFTLLFLYADAYKNDAQLKKCIFVRVQKRRRNFSEYVRSLKTYLKKRGLR